MKKIIVVLVSLLLLTGCGNSGSTNHQIAGAAKIKVFEVETNTETGDISTNPQAKEPTNEEKPASNQVDEKNHTSSNQSSNSSSASNDTTTNPSSSNSTTTDTPPVTKTKYVTVSIDCLTILNNMNDIKDNYTSFIPANGYLLKETKVEITDSDTALSVLKKAAKDNGIKIVNQNGYISSIGFIYEKAMKNNDGGWMYFVNGAKGNVGAGSYKLSNGDFVRWRYTSHPGDIG